MGTAALTVEALLESIAARRPTPGGGAAAALTVALAAATGEMAGRYSRADEAPGVCDALARLRREALRLADADAEAFGKLAALWKRKPADRPADAWSAAVAGAIEAPRQVIAAALEVLDALGGLPDAAAGNLRSDVAVAALLARGGAEAAAWNVRVNIPLVEDRRRAARIEADTAAALRRAGAAADRIDAACRGAE